MGPSGAQVGIPLQICYVVVLDTVFSNEQITVISILLGSFPWQ